LQKNKKNNKKCRCPFCHKHFDKNQKYSETFGYSIYCKKKEIRGQLLGKFLKCVEEKRRKSWDETVTFARGFGFTGSPLFPIFLCSRLKQLGVYQSDQRFGDLHFYFHLITFIIRWD
jgi:hypothetical protein